MNFRLNPHHVILSSLISGKVTFLAFSKVHPAALATHALKDLPRMNLVLAVDSSLVHDTSLRLWHVDSMRHISFNTSVEKHLYNLS